MKLLNLIAMLILSVTVFGQTLQNFELNDARNGKNVSLKDFSSSKGIVLIFSSNECPFDEYYSTRIQELAAAYGDKVPVMLVNSHVEAGESAEAMATYLRRAGLDLPYLADKKQVILNSLSPRKTPEAFLLQNKNDQFSVIYRGAIDDNAQSADDVKNSYLKTSIEELLAGKSLTTSEERAVGCSVRKSKN
jgi:hypothetical protein